MRKNKFNSREEKKQVRDTKTGSINGNQFNLLEKTEI